MGSTNAKPRGGGARAHSRAADDNRHPTLSSHDHQSCWTAVTPARLVSAVHAWRRFCPGLPLPPSLQLELARSWRRWQVVAALEQAPA
jgi:hypothetical protein